jgi:phosphomannomutase
MPEIKDDIFKAYDIRGKYPTEVDEDLAYHVGSAVARYFGAREIVVGYDGRKSSPELAKAVTKGLKECGSRVCDIGYCTTPMFYFAVNYLKKAGGIMVTASHNPNNDNGFKVIDPNGIPIFPADFKEMVLEKPKKIDGAKVSKYDVENHYIEYLIRKSGLKKCEVDLEIRLKAKDKTLELAKKILDNIGMKISNDNGLIFEFDKDGDRLEVGGIRPDYLFGLFVKEELKKFHLFTPKFVYDLRFTKAIPEYIEENGGEAVKSRVGHAFMKREMYHNSAKIGGEFSGHFYFKDMHYMDDALMAMLRTIYIALKGNLIEGTKPFQKYYHSGEISIKYEGDRNMVIDRLADEYSDGEVEMIDGLSVSYPNWWFNIRPSNTEPLLRLVVESDSETIMMERIEETKKAIRSLTE